MLWVAGRTDAGRHRTVNEDAFGIVVLGEGVVFGVYDGLGSTPAGATASAVTERIVREMFLEGPPVDLEHPLSTALGSANRVLFERAASQPEWRGLGCTATIASVVGDQLAIAHVGDTRAYVLRAGELTQVSRDHTLGSGLESHRHVFTRAIGTSAHVDVETTSLRLGDDAIVVLCTDGLWRLVDVSKVTEILLAHGSPEAACDALIDAANAAGGADNVTVVVAR